MEKVSLSNKARERRLDLALAVKTAMRRNIEVVAVDIKPMIKDDTYRMSSEFGLLPEWKYVKIVSSDRMLFFFNYVRKPL